ncbi:X-ray repair cross-complementing protein 5-like [Battus philenor]|uniref:X-ray repair cross-complementing protein 5-like n=1 Tax=Battus philenor TaxID=42288 RepID=UPI0035D0D562
MSKKVEQATLLILDIGKNTADAEEKGAKSFFEETIECTKRIIERKIMSQGKDLVGIILLGSKNTKNNMASQCPGAFKHIELFIELEVPSWKMIRDLPIAPTNKCGDWFDALIVAADFFKNGVSGIKCCNRRIILMTNFKKNSSIDEDGFKQALQGFQEEDFQVDVIGIDIYSEPCKESGIKFIRKFVEDTNGVTAQFDDTMRYLVFHKKKHVNAMPWNVDLCIGPNVKIPVSSYIRIRDDSIVKKWTQAVRDPITGKASSTEAVGKNRIYVQNENRYVVDSVNLLNGYQYGQEVIPFDNQDKALLYKSGEKSLLVYGFTDSKKIQWQNFNGNGLLYIFGRKGDKKAQNAVKCLVTCLRELNLVGVVRRVYYKDVAPRMFALMPVIDSNDFICLSMAEICFKEEIKHMAFPQTELTKFACTKDQVDAFKDLIKNMDLTNAYEADEFDDKEAFPVGETISPSAQYVLDCIAFRAMNPGKPLPPPRNDIMMLFKVPPLVEKRSTDVIERLKSLFILNKVEQSTRRVGIKTLDESPSKATDETNHSNLPQVNLSLPIKPMPIRKIGTINPISDYQFLQDSGKVFSDLASEMISAIESLMFSNLNEHCVKAIDAINFFRSESVKSDPTYYNNWILNFKCELYDRKKHDIIELIREKQLNSIQKHENSLSNFDSKDQDDSQIYEMDTAPGFTEMEISSEVNNLFNDM